jgi:glucose-6-phosphate 1-dehydrogenase
MTLPASVEGELERAEEWVAQPAPPCAMVIFGATGDLTKRKLIPAIYNLIVNGLLPDGFAVVGVGRSQLSDDEFRHRMEENLREFATDDIDDRKLEWLIKRLRYVVLDPEKPETFKGLAETLAQLDEEQGTRRLHFVKGPIFAQIILADEINRTPPKTQAALLEAMQELHVTAAGRTYHLERPFFVLATQNPIEQ